MFAQFLVGKENYYVTKAMTLIFSHKITSFELLLVIYGYISGLNSDHVFYFFFFRILHFYTFKILAQKGSERSVGFLNDYFLMLR